MSVIDCYQEAKMKTKSFVNCAIAAKLNRLNFIIQLTDERKAVPAYVFEFINVMLGRHISALHLLNSAQPVVDSIERQDYDGKLDDWANSN